jgi:hypothetical protein
VVGVGGGHGGSVEDGQNKPRHAGSESARRER